jgi:DNA excision repair protein ERCC-1
MVDISNHEDSLRELSKTSLVNNVTIILCWSAAEAARYLELYKSYEHASFAAIRGQQATSYADKLVEFVTVPRSINKADAISLVSSFGSIRNAINADAEQVGLISGWGERKVKNWIKAIDEPFRVQTAAKRQRDTSGNASRFDDAVPLGRVPLREMSTAGGTASPRDQRPAARSVKNMPRQTQIWNPDIADNDDAMVAAALEEQPGSSSRTTQNDELSDGVAAALARLRQND